MVLPSKLRVVGWPCSCTHQFTHAFAILIMIMIHSMNCMVSRLHDASKVSI